MRSHALIFTTLTSIAAVMISAYVRIIVPGISLTSTSVFGIVVPLVVLVVGLDMLAGGAAEPGGEAFPTLSQLLVIFACASSANGTQ